VTEILDLIRQIHLRTDTRPIWKVDRRRKSNLPKQHQTSSVGRFGITNPPLKPAEADLNDRSIAPNPPPKQARSQFRWMDYFVPIRLLGRPKSIQMTHRQSQSTSLSKHEASSVKGSVIPAVSPQIDTRPIRWEIIDTSPSDLPNQHEVSSINWTDEASIQQAKRYKTASIVEPVPSI
jgi:hypothetical protein